MSGNLQGNHALPTNTINLQNNTCSHTALTYNHSMFTFIELPIFTKYAADYFGDDALAELQASIAKNPAQGDVIRGTNGVRKLRWGRAGMGKRGGVRVIYFMQDIEGRIWLLTVYAKSAHENISVTTLNQLREVAENAQII